MVCKDNFSFKFVTIDCIFSGLISGIPVMLLFSWQGEPFVSLKDLTIKVAWFK